jgi:hypothetical protein
VYHVKVRLTLELGFIFRPYCEQYCNIQVLFNEMHHVIVSELKEMNAYGCFLPVGLAEVQLCLAQVYTERKHQPLLFVPTCLEDGTFAPVQCHAETGYCWCVTPVGKPIPNSSLRNARPNCSRRGEEDPGFDTLCLTDAHKTERREKKR